MDPRRWCLLAGAALAALACAGAVVDPALPTVADCSVALLAVLSTALLWSVAGREEGTRRNWRLLAIAPLFPALGMVLVVLVHPPDPLQAAVLRWVSTVPGNVLVVVAVLGLAGPRRLRTGGLRSVVEVALFLTGCLITEQLLVLGPDRRWGDLGLGEQLVLGAVVLVTSASIAAALTHLGVVEPARQRAALVLLGGMMLLTAGRGLGTTARLIQATSTLDASRFLVIGGLTAYVLAGLLDLRPGAAPARPAVARTTALGQLLPHIEMVVATGAVVVHAALGFRPSTAEYAALVVCVLLAAVHRCLTMREERRLSRRLRRSEAYFRSVVRSGTDAVLILDGDLRVDWTSPALDRVLGDAAAAALGGRPLLDLVHPDDVAALTAVLPGAGPREQGGDAVGGGLQLFRLRDDAGAWRVLEAGIADLRRDSDVGGVVLQCRDMTERNAREQSLKSTAYSDPMTGLPNRAGLLRLLGDRLAAPASGPAALLLIQLEGIVDARESAGHDVVSEVVAEIGRRLRATVRGDDVVARMGAGAFSVLAEGTAAEADRLAARCLAVVEQPIATTAGVLDLSAGIGVAPVEDGLTVEELRSRAALAARAAGAAGPGVAVRYSTGLGDAAARHERLRTDLVGALDRGEFSLVYQPVVAVAEQRVVGLEALLRWRHPVLGQIPPAEFLPIAELSGLIGPLSRWVLQEATAAAAPLPSSDDSPMRLGVNLSSGYLAGGTVIPDVRAALDASGLPPHRLVLDITGDALHPGDERAGLDVDTLRLMGIRIALDDFGTDDSTLGQLTRLPLDVLKIDGSLVARVDKDPQARALFESIVTFGRALGFQVGAESIETPAQLAVLCAVGCDLAQGFLIGRPTSLAEFTALVRDGAGQLWPGLVASR